MKGKIFNAQEVQAIIAGNKTMFREIVKRRKIPKVWQYKIEENGIREVPCPYQVGQKIFCKESFCNPFVNTYYAADDLHELRYVKWKPAQHMKQEHSRLTLLIKEIRVEKLAEISDKDLLKEGMQITDEWTAPAGDLDFENENMDAFKNNWNATHKKPEEKFEADPWVWCVSFEVINN
jgi:hypothetical protein